MTSNRSSSGPLSAFSLLSFDSQSAPDEDEPRTDLEGLVQYLTQLREAGSRLIEVTYVVNRWALAGIIPMTHHGFIFQSARSDYFTLDFGRKGIVWDTMDELPELPDNTFYTKMYKLDIDTRPVQTYCEETPPFNFPFYDCETWAKGLLAKLGLDKSEGERKTREVCSPAPSLGEMSSGSPRKAPTTPARKQRTGTCI